MRRWTVALAALLTLSALGAGLATAWADDVDPCPEGPEVAVYSALAGAAEFENDRGEMAMAKAGARIAYQGFSLDYSVTGFTWDDESRLPFGSGNDAPWDRFHQVALQADHSGELGKGWGYFAGAKAGAAYEKEMDDSFSLEAFGGLSYGFSESLTASAGVMAGVDAIRASVLPMLNIAWDGRENGRGWYATLGVPETSLGYAFGKALQVHADLGMDGATYRLADDSSVRRKGYVKLEGMQARLMADYSPAEDLTLSLGPTYDFARSLKFYNKDGDEQGSYDLGGALGVAAAIRYAF